MVCETHTFQHLGVSQQYPELCWTQLRPGKITRIPKKPLQLSPLTLPGQSQAKPLTVQPVPPTAGGWRLVRTLPDGTPVGIGAYPSRDACEERRTHVFTPRQLIELRCVEEKQPEAGSSIARRASAPHTHPPRPSRKRLGHSGGKKVARMTRSREARWYILTRSQETKKGNPGLYPCHSLPRGPARRVMGI